MPSILIELGFISTPTEERYLNSSNGINEMAKGIYYAFLNYKREHELRLTEAVKTIVPTEPGNTKSETPSPITEIKEENKGKIDDRQKMELTADTTPLSQTSEQTTESYTRIESKKEPEIIFKLQILTSVDNRYPKNDKRLKGLKDVDYYKEGGIYKYTYGASPDYNKVLRTKRSIATLFNDAFIIAFEVMRR